MKDILKDKVVYLTLFVVVLVAVVWRVNTSVKVEDNSWKTYGNDEVSHLRSDVKSLQRQLADLATLMGELQDKLNKYPPKISQDKNINAELIEATDLEISISKSVDEIDQQVASELDLFDSEMMSEERDDQWASAMEGEITSYMDDETFQNSTIIDSQCKSTFCRVEVSHDSDLAKSDFEMITRFYKGSYHIQHLDGGYNGGSKSVAYFIREGEEQNNIIYQTFNPQKL